MKKYITLLIAIINGLNSYGQTTFSYTGAVQTYTVPSGVTALDVDVMGAKGGQKDATYIGGKGGRVQATVDVTPGEVLYIYVGGAGTTASTVASGGYNGGGGIVHHVGSSVAGTGGGASDIRRTPYTTSDRLVVAGGGGGGGYQNLGGHGGETTAVNGGFYPSFPNSGGKAGTPSAGGAAGVSSSYCNGYNSAGSFAQGGTGDGDGAGGGGGGGGYYGGGGGCFAAGGGGSSFTAASGVTSITHTQGYQNGNGSIIITPQAPTYIVSSASQTNVSCFGGSNGSASVAVTGGTSPFTYNWTPGNPTGDGTISVSGLTAGTWTCTVTDANSATTSVSFTITQPTSSVSLSTSTTNLLCNNINSGAINLTPTGGTSPYTYMWSNAATTEDLTGLSAGTYTVGVMDANLCPVTTISATLTEPSAITATTSQTDLVCNGGTTGIASVTPSGGTSPYDYEWSFGGTNDIEGSLEAGTYTCTITDANSCTLVKTITLTEPTALTATRSQTNLLCRGITTGAASVSISGGTPSYTYAWSQGATTASINGLSAGSFTCTITDLNSCSIEESFTITQPASVISATTFKTDISCFGNSDGIAGVNATGGTGTLAYAWSNGGINNVEGSLDPATYTCTVTDDNGCTLVKNVTIIEPDSFMLALTISNISCNGLSNGSALATLSGGTAPFSYLWTSSTGSFGVPPTPSTTSSWSNLEVDNFSLAILDNHGCSIDTSFEITEPTVISVSTSKTDVTCNSGATGSGTITASGGTGTLSYAWSNGRSTATELNLIAGTYTITVSDANSCTSITSITIDEPSAITITPSQNNVSCNGGNNGDASITVSGGTGPYTYVWSNGGITDTLQHLSAGTYTITVTDDNGCTKNSSIQITEPTTLSVTLSMDSVTCNGLSDGAALATPAGGTTPYSYLWTGGATTASISGLSATSFSVSVSDNHGCTVAGSITVLEPTSVTTTNSSTQPSCYASSDGVATVLPSGGTAPYSYNWSTGGTLGTITGLVAGTYSISVTDNNGCLFDTSVTVNQPDSLALNITTQPVSCKGLSDGIAYSNPTGGTAPYTYIWGGGQPSLPSLSGLAAQSFSVAIQDDHGCFNAQSVTITEPDSITVTISTTDPLCNGGVGSATIIGIGGTGTINYAWSSGGSSSTENNLIADTYIVSLIDSNSCTLDTIVTINEPSAITTNTSATNANCSQLNGSAAVIANGGTGNLSYAWSSGGSADTLNNIAAGIYTVTITDDNGCSTSDVATVSNIGAPNVTVAHTDVICHGESNGTIDLTITGGVPNYLIAWSNSGTTSSLTGLPGNTYNYSITDAANCITTGSVSISEPDSLSITSTTINETQGQDGEINITVTGGTANYTYLWNNGETTEDLTALSAGTYTVTVTDANNCSKEETIVVSSSVGIEQLAQVEDQIFVFPNPNDGVFTIKGASESNYSLKNNLGQTIRYIILNADNNYSSRINNLSEGVYFLQHEANKFGIIKKIVVIK